MFCISSSMTKRWCSAASFFLFYMHGRLGGSSAFFIIKRPFSYSLKGEVGAVDTYPITSLSLSLDLGMDGMDWDWMERAGGRWNLVSQ